jgi:hypothetical protein
MAHGDFAWNELMTTDMEAAKAFYGGLMGWEPKAWPLGDGGTYWLWKRGETSLGGAMAMSGAPGEPDRPAWTVYIAVDDVDAACGKAEALGGSVVMPPMDVPEVGRFAILADPAGAVFGVMKGLEDG